MTADSVNRLSGDYPDCNNNDTMNITDMMDDDECYISSCNQYRVEIAIALSFLVGLILVSVVYIIAIALSFLVGLILVSVVYIIAIALSLLVGLILVSVVY